MRTFSISDAITFGWDIFKKRPWFLIGIFILSNFINFLPYLVSGYLRTLDNTMISVLLGIAFWILNFIIGIGLITISLELINNKKAEFLDLINGYRYLLYFFLCTVLLVILFLLPFLLPMAISWVSQLVPTFSGSLFYISLILAITIAVITFIYLLVTFQFSFYFLVDKNSKPIDALKESKKITKGVKWKLFLLLVLLILLHLGGLAFFVVGVFITDAISLMASVYVYKKLSGSTLAEK